MQGWPERLPGSIVIRDSSGAAHARDDNAIPEATVAENLSGASWVQGISGASKSAIVSLRRMSRAFAPSTSTSAARIRVL
jgi:hypothetical protein